MRKITKLHTRCRYYFSKLYHMWFFRFINPADKYAENIIGEMFYNGRIDLRIFLRIITQHYKLSFGKSFNDLRNSRKLTTMIVLTRSKYCGQCFDLVQQVNAFRQFVYFYKLIYITVQVPFTTRHIKKCIVF